MSLLIFRITLCLARDQTRFGPPTKRKKRHEIEIHAGALKSHKRWPANVITPCSPPQKKWLQFLTLIAVFYKHNDSYYYNKI